MKKASNRIPSDDLRPEYDLSALKGGFRGTYYREAIAGTAARPAGRQSAAPSAGPVKPTRQRG